MAIDWRFWQVAIGIGAVIVLVAAAFAIIWAALADWFCDE